MISVNIEVSCFEEDVSRPVSGNVSNVKPDLDVISTIEPETDSEDNSSKDDDSTINPGVAVVSSAFFEDNSSVLFCSVSREISNSVVSFVVISVSDCPSDVENRSSS